MVSLRDFSCSSSTGVTAMGTNSARKAVGQAGDGAHRGKTPLHLCKPEIKVRNERIISKDQHSFSQILVPDLS